jgi:methylamine--corrinoid protein Co-methyltransferase
MKPDNYCKEQIVKKLDRLLDVIDRMYSGPVVDEKEFDRERVTKGVARVVKEYDITFNQDQIIQQNDEMIDRVWAAAKDFVVSCGVYNISSNRVFMFTREEIEEALEQAPSKVTIGEGKDSRILQVRQVEDPRPPQVSGGPIGTPITEDLWIPVMQSYYQEPIIDNVVAGIQATTYGRQVRSGTPLEILAAWLESEMTMEAAARAGRPGLSRNVVQASYSDIGHLSAVGSGGFRAVDMHVIPFISEMKTHDELLNKITHSIMQNGVITGYYNPILGGLGGGPEGLAVLLTAGFMALQMVYLPDTVESCPTHPHLSCSTVPQIIQAISVTAAAFARNSHVLTEFMTSPVGGPCTDTLLYECVAMATAVSASGASRVFGVRSAVGVVENHCTGLEARFNGEVAHAAAGISRAEADEIVKKAITLYEPRLREKPMGVPFTEAYGLDTLQPNERWQEVYDRVKNEVRDWGLPLT